MFRGRARGRRPHNNSAMGSGIRDHGRNDTSRGPLTHFLCLPIGHHIRLQQNVSAFTNGLMNCTPAIPGLDRSIVIPSRRLHLTLGVMSLVDSVPPTQGGSAPALPKTLADARSLLASLKPRIMELLQGHRLCVPLQQMCTMEPGNPDHAHILWLGSRHNDEDARRLQTIGEMVNRAFRDAGFITERRPLKLHCTILNTVYRKPRVKGPRQSFSYRALLSSSACRPQLSPSDDIRRPIKMDFGKWDVDEIQICKMGSFGPEGEYVSCGGISLS